MKIWTRTFASVLALVLALVLARGLVNVASAAQKELQSDEQEAAWDIEISRASEHYDLDFEATEGTRISLDVSPDGTTIAFDLLGHIYELPIEGGEARALTSGRSWNINPRYSPNGAQLAFTSDRAGSEDLWVMNRDGADLKNISEMESPVYTPTWSADGSALYGTSQSDKATSNGVRFNLRGGKNQIREGKVIFQSLGQFVEYPEVDLVLYEFKEGTLYQSGFAIHATDLNDGSHKPFIKRTGGAFNPTLSPDHRFLAYGHRDDTDAQIILHDLASGDERVLASGLDRDRQDGGSFIYAQGPGMSWSPDSRRLYFADSGKIQFVEIKTGESSQVPFRAAVKRQMDKTIRFPVAVPQGRAQTRLHRWAHRTDKGILYETLGDIWLSNEGRIDQLTDTPALETDPVYNRKDGKIYYASWTDSDLGAIYRRKPNGGRAEKLSSRATQYGGLAISPDGQTLAYFRGDTTLGQGQALEWQLNFELVVREDKEERVLAKVTGTLNTMSKMPLTIRFSPDGEFLYYTWFNEDVLTLSRIHRDGRGEQDLYTFPNSVYARVSPDLKWIAYREYHRSFITPLSFVGVSKEISAFDGKEFSIRVDERDGTFLSWPDSETLGWVRAGEYMEKSVSDIVAAIDNTRVVPVAVEYDVVRPAGAIALTHVRVITMNPNRDVLEDATVLVEGNRITALGTNVAIPSQAEVMDLGGHTLMPGMVDAHGHYKAFLSQFNVVEQQVPGLLAPLAHGVTTLYELYGTAEKDGWIMDMLRAGKMQGSRLFSVGHPAYGLKQFRPKTLRPIEDYAAAKALVSWNQDHGATAIKDYAIFTRKARHQLMTAARELGINVVSESTSNVWVNLTQILDGTTGIEHSMGITPLYQDMLEVFKASEVGMTPTLLVVYDGPVGQAYFNQRERVWEDPKLLRFLRRDDLLAGKRTIHLWPDDHYAPAMAAEMKKLFDQGVLINMGGHGQMPGLDAHWEMELMVQGGFSPLEAIQTATINGATYHGLDRDLGSVEMGKLADLVILSADPRDDIRNSRKIDYVMKNGELFQAQDLTKIYPESEALESMYFNR